MNEVTIFILVGVLGGVARAAYGLLKSISAGYEINYGYFLVTLIASGAIGGMLGYGKVLSFLAGYAGIDLIDGYYKAFMKKKVKV